jgi:hypothetical protein
VCLLVMHSVPQRNMLPVVLILLHSAVVQARLSDLMYKVSSRARPQADTAASSRYLLLLL